MRLKVGLVACALALAGLACNSDTDEPEESVTPTTFTLTGEVVSASGDTVEIKPSGTATGLDDCLLDDGNYEVSLETAISAEPASLKGKTITIEGDAAREDTGCTLEAKTVTEGSGDTGTGTGGATSSGSPGGVAPQSSPDSDETPGPADEGSILDETPSPAP
jgi:hypothetical protein